MKRNMIIIAVLAAAVMFSGCGTTATNSLDKAATEVQSDSAVSTASASADRTSSGESEKTASISVASLDGVWNCTTSDASLWFTKGDDIYKGTWHDNLEEGDVKLEYSVDGSGEKHTGIIFTITEVSFGIAYTQQARYRLTSLS